MDCPDMKCAKDYQALVNASGQMAFIIPAQENAPKSPKLVYNGSDVALLYRAISDVLVLDKLHEEAQKHLKQISSVVIIEIDYASDTIVYDYQVSVVKTGEEA